MVSVWVLQAACLIIIIIKDITASSQRPQMRYVGRDGSMVTYASL